MAWIRKVFGTSPPPVSLDQHEAEQELRCAQMKLHESQKQALEAQRVARRLEQINRENHFADRAMTVLKGIVQ